FYFSCEVMANSVLRVVILVIGIAAWAIHAQVPPPTQLDPNEWWGPKELQGRTNETVRHFEIRFCDEMIHDLVSRLKRHRKLAPPLEGTAFYYGFNTNQIDPWVKYWAEEYDFKEREAYFNQYPHYKTNIQGLDIHFLRVTPQ
ncbi:jg20547, partial [Pararge aegeria aegeria]